MENITGTHQELPKRRLSRIFLSMQVLFLGGMLGNASLAARFENPLSDLKSLSHHIGDLDAIAQDHHGFIWIGGDNGLGRYDGRDIKLYPSVAGVANSLPSPLIMDLALDQDNTMWIASSGGLSRFNYATDDFETFSAIGGTPFANKSMSSLAVDAGNNLYVGTKQGLYKIDAARQHMQVFVPDPPIKRAPDEEQIWDITIAPDGKVWLASGNMGVAIFDPEKETFKYLFHRPGDANSLIHNAVRTTEIDRHGRVWIGTYGGGISVYHPKNGRFKHFPYAPDKEGGLHSALILDIYEDSEGRLWIASDSGGLARFQEESETFEHFLHHRYEPTTVISNNLRVVFEDANSDLWIGAFPYGISYYNRSKQRFHAYTAKPGDPTSLSNDAIISLFQDSKGTVWVGTEDGLNAFDKRTGTFRQYRANPLDPQALKAGPVLAIEEDSHGNLWVGTWSGGLHRFDRATEIFHRYRPNENVPGSIGSDFIWDIEEDRQKNLWIATLASGLNLYHRESDSFTRYQHRPEDEASISGDSVWTIMEDRRGHLWVGGYTELDLFDPDSGRFYRPPPNNHESPTSRANTRTIYEDSRGLVWMGTQDQGASIFDPKSQTFKNIDQSHGLPASTVSSIVEDSYGNMWLATINGLARVEYPSLKITTYGIEHGLAGSHFNRDASLRDNQGNLYFGSTEGLSVFHPDNLNAAKDFPIRLTAFRILNEHVTVGEDSPLKSSIVMAKEVKLTHKDVMFSFDFAALNYRSPSTTRYAYKLEGFDRDWNHIGTRATATYTNIDPGRYTFRVKATTGNGVWNDNGPALKLTIEPPPWRTWWAYLGYAGLMSTGLYFRRAYLRLRSSAQSYKAQSITDPLTGLYNRAGIAQMTENLFSNSKSRKNTAVMLVDIDHFKRINDNYGHNAGDGILAATAKLMSEIIRRGDYIGRWGGEEFILICPDAEADPAQAIAEKIRHTVEYHIFAAEGTQVQITVSVGIAITRPNDLFHTVLKRADIALYQAKSAGRNHVCIADSDYGLYDDDTTN